MLTRVELQNLLLESTKATIKRRDEIKDRLLQEASKTSSTADESIRLKIVNSYKSFLREADKTPYKDAVIASYVDILATWCC